MKKLNKLIATCKSRNYNVSITYQSINDISIEIYKGYGFNYKKLYYTDSHLKPKQAIKAAFKFLNIKVLKIANRTNKETDVCKLCKFKGYCDSKRFKKCLKELKDNQYYK